MIKGKSRGDNIIYLIINVIAVLVLLITFYPLYFITIASISDPNAVSLGKVFFRPSGIDFSGYGFIFNEPRIWLGYKNTIIYTVFGTAMGVVVTIMAGYALSIKNLVGRNVIMKIFVFTMFFTGGLIPTYMVVDGLNLINTPFVLMLLGSVWVYNIILARTFFQNTLPDELREAAYIDGCRTGRFFISIALPLSKAIIAVIALYYAVGHWNAYFNALIYVTKKELYPLQLILREILILGQSLSAGLDADELDSLAEMQRVANTIKYGVIIVSTLPIICAYPFIQRYFVEGVMLGSIKG